MPAFRPFIWIFNTIAIMYWIDWESRATHSPAAMILDFWFITLPFALFFGLIQYVLLVYLPAVSSTSKEKKFNHRRFLVITTSLSIALLLPGILKIMEIHDFHVLVGGVMLAAHFSLLPGLVYSFFEHTINLGARNES